MDNRIEWQKRLACSPAADLAKNWTLYSVKANPSVKARIEASRSSEFPETIDSALEFVDSDTVSIGDPFMHACIFVTS